MTEIEKKAEEYAKDFKNDSCYKVVELAYINGYKQGKKDTFNIYDSELNDISENYSYRLKQLVKEHEELKKDKEYLDKVNNEQTEVILKLNEQNEKMKCCENCNLYDCTVDCIHTKCKYQYSEMCRDKTMIDKWEIAK